METYFGKITSIDNNLRVAVVQIYNKTERAAWLPFANLKSPGLKLEIGNKVLFGLEKQPNGGLLAKNVLLLEELPDCSTCPKFTKN